MFLIFVACGLATLPKLGIHRADPHLDRPHRGKSENRLLGRVFLRLVLQRRHAPRHERHVGAALRQNPSCGWAPAAGMYLGHCIAWICASLLYAYQLQKHGTDPASVAPGPMVSKPSAGPA
jgi:nucleobase:cation symporter-1, NCS1 family